MASRNILVLEDEPLVAMMLEDELESMGIHVVGPANNLKSALQLAELSILDGALLDLNINGTYATKILAFFTETFPSCTNHFHRSTSEWRSSRS